MFCWRDRSGGGSDCLCWVFRQRLLCMYISGDVCALAFVLVFIVFTCRAHTHTHTRRTETNACECILNIVATTKIFGTHEHLLTRKHTSLAHALVQMCIWTMPCVRMCVHVCVCEDHRMQCVRVRITVHAYAYKCVLFMWRTALLRTLSVGHDHKQHILNYFWIFCTLSACTGCEYVGLKLIYMHIYYILLNYSCFWKSFEQNTFVY